MRGPEFSIVIPCLNEAATIVACIQKAKGFLVRTSIHGEVIVADNGSADGSRELSARAGARVIDVQEQGYGAALRGGISAAAGQYIIMGDADDSYDFSNLDLFVAELRNGSDLVMGNRFDGGIHPGAMPALHRYVGNPALSFLGRLFFRVSVRDFHCGLRGFARDKILKLGLVSAGMEFASEMIVKASLAGLRITEVPTTLSRDGRGRPSHLRTWRDGWRHLQFLLTFSPRWLFLYPGLALLTVGTILQGSLLHEGVRLGSIGIDIHTMLYASAMSVMGVQLVWFAVLAKAYGMRLGLLPHDTRIERAIKALSLERGVVIGGFLLLGGIILSFSAVQHWSAAGYGALDPRAVMRTAIPAISMMLIGMEFVIASFFLGLLRFEKRVSERVDTAGDASSTPPAPASENRVVSSAG